MPVFVDTNVFVYARDGSEPEKQPRAHEWLATLWRAREGRLSFQVLQEYFVAVTRKLSPGLDREEAQADIQHLLAWRPVGVNGSTLDAAWAVERRFGLSFWETLIVASAQSAGCTNLLTEDLAHGQELDGVRVVNPFLQAPGSLR